jgi:hypothetical protein
MLGEIRTFDLFIFCISKYAMPDVNQPKRKRSRKIESFAPGSLPETMDPKPDENKPRTQKNGFYSNAFTRLEVGDLDVINQEKLFDEIALLRVAIRRCFEAASNMEATDVEGWVKALSSLGMASTRLAGLLRSQWLLTTGGNDSFLSILSSALTSVRKELDL